MSRSNWRQHKMREIGIATDRYHRPETRAAALAALDATLTVLSKLFPEATTEQIYRTTGARENPLWGGAMPDHVTLETLRREGNLREIMAAYLNLTVRNAELRYGTTGFTLDEGIARLLNRPDWEQAARELEADIDVDMLRAAIREFRKDHPDKPITAADLREVRYTRVRNSHADAIFDAYDIRKEISYNRTPVDQRRRSLTSRDLAAMGTPLSPREFAALIARPRVLRIERIETPTGREFRRDHRGRVDADRLEAQLRETDPTVEYVVPVYAVDESGARIRDDDGICPVEFVEVYHHAGYIDPVNAGRLDHTKFTVELSWRQGSALVEFKATSDYFRRVAVELGTALTAGISGTTTRMLWRLLLLRPDGVPERDFIDAMVAFMVPHHHSLYEIELGLRMMGRSLLDDPDDGVVDAEVLAAVYDALDPGPESAHRPPADGVPVYSGPAPAEPEPPAGMVRARAATYGRAHDVPVPADHLPVLQIEQLDPGYALPRTRSGLVDLSALETQLKAADPAVEHVAVTYADDERTVEAVLVHRRVGTVDPGNARRLDPARYIVPGADDIAGTTPRPSTTGTEPQATTWPGRAAMPTAADRITRQFERAATIAPPNVTKGESPWVFNRFDPGTTPPGAADARAGRPGDAATDADEQLIGEIYHRVGDRELARTIIATARAQRPATPDQLRVTARELAVQHGRFARMRQAVLIDLVIGADDWNDANGRRVHVDATLIEAVHSATREQWDRALATLDPGRAEPLMREYWEGQRPDYAPGGPRHAAVLELATALRGTQSAERDRESTNPAPRSSDREGEAAASQQIPGLRPRDEYRFLGGESGVELDDEMAHTLIATALSSMDEAVSGSWNLNIPVGDPETGRFMVRIAKHGGDGMDTRVAAEWRILELLAEFGVGNIPRVYRVLPDVELPDGSRATVQIQSFFDDAVTVADMSRTTVPLDRVLEGIRQIRRELSCTQIGEGDPGLFIRQLVAEKRKLWNSLRAEFGPVFDRLRVSEDPFEYVVEQSRGLDPVRFAVIHGDLHFGNLMLTLVDGQLVVDTTEVVALDWEMARFGDSAYDPEWFNHLAGRTGLADELPGGHVYALFFDVQRIIHDTVRLARAAAVGRLTPAQIKFAQTELFNALIAASVEWHDDRHRSVSPALTNYRFFEAIEATNPPPAQWTEPTFAPATDLPANSLPYRFSAAASGLPGPAPTPITPPAELSSHDLATVADRVTPLSAHSFDALLERLRALSDDEARTLLDDLAGAVVTSVNMLRRGETMPSRQLANTLRVLNVLLLEVQARPGNSPAPIDDYSTLFRTARQLVDRIPLQRSIAAAGDALIDGVGALTVLDPIFAMSTLEEFVTRAHRAAVLMERLHTQVPWHLEATADDTAEPDSDHRGPVRAADRNLVILEETWQSYFARADVLDRFLRNDRASTTTQELPALFREHADLTAAFDRAHQGTDAEFAGSAAFHLASLIDVASYYLINTRDTATGVELIGRLCDDLAAVSERLPRLHIEETVDQLRKLHIVLSDLRDTMAGYASPRPIRKEAILALDRNSAMMTALDHVLADLRTAGGLLPPQAGDDNNGAPPEGRPIAITTELADALLREATFGGLQIRLAELTDAEATTLLARIRARLDEQLAALDRGVAPSGTEMADDTRLLNGLVAELTLRIGSQLPEHIPDYRALFDVSTKLAAVAPIVADIAKATSTLFDSVGTVTDRGVDLSHLLVFASQITRTADQIDDKVRHIRAIRLLPGSDRGVRALDGEPLPAHRNAVTGLLAKLDRGWRVDHAAIDAAVRTHRHSSPTAFELFATVNRTAAAFEEAKAASEISNREFGALAADHVYATLDAAAHLLIYRHHTFAGREMLARAVDILGRTASRLSGRASAEHAAFELGRSIDFARRGADRFAVDQTDIIMLLHRDSPTAHALGKALHELRYPDDPATPLSWFGQLPPTWHRFHASKFSQTDVELVAANRTVTGDDELIVPGNPDGTAGTGSEDPFVVAATSNDDATSDEDEFVIVGTPDDIGEPADRIEDEHVASARDRLRRDTTAFERARSENSSDLDLTTATANYVTDLLTVATHEFTSAGTHTGIEHLGWAIDALGVAAERLPNHPVLTDATHALRQLHQQLTTAKRAAVRDIARTALTGNTPLHNTIDEALALLRRIGCATHAARTLWAYGNDEQDELENENITTGERLEDVIVARLRKMPDGADWLHDIAEKLERDGTAVLTADNGRNAHAWVITNINGLLFITDTLIDTEPGIPRTRELTDDWQTEYDITRDTFHVAYFDKHVVAKAEHAFDTEAEPGLPTNLQGPAGTPDREPDTSGSRLHVDTPYEELTELVKVAFARGNRDRAIEVLRERFGDKIYRWLSRGYGEGRLARELTDEMITRAVDGIPLKPADLHIERWIIAKATRLMREYDAFVEFRDRLVRVATSYDFSTPDRDQLGQATVAELELALESIRLTGEGRAKLDALRSGSHVSSTEPAAIESDGSPDPELATALHLLTRELRLAGTNMRRGTAAEVLRRLASAPDEQIAQELNLTAAGLNQIFIELARQLGIDYHHELARAAQQRMDSDPTWSSRLAARHIELIGLLNQGMTAKQCAAAMGLSVITVRGYIQRISARSGIKLRDFVLLHAARRGIVETPIGEIARIRLTDREKQIIVARAQDLSYTEISEQLGITRTTAEDFGKDILAKLSTGNWKEVFDFAITEGLIEKHPDEIRWEKILLLLAGGHTRTSAAAALNRSYQWLIRHTASLASELGTVDKTSALVTYGIHRGLIDAPAQFPIELTPLERFFLTAIAYGATHEQIAEQVSMSKSNVTGRIISLRNRTHSATTAELITKTVEQLYFAPNHSHVLSLLGTATDAEISEELSISRRALYRLYNEIAHNLYIDYHSALAAAAEHSESEGTPPRFQARHLELIDLFRRGKTPGECAALMGLSTNSIHRYTQEIGNTLGLKLRDVIRERAIRLGMIEGSPEEDGRIRLSDREIQVVEARAQNMSYADIAEQLDISRETAWDIAGNIFRKLSTDSWPEVFAFAVGEDLLLEYPEEKLRRDILTLLAAGHTIPGAAAALDRSHDWLLHRAADLSRELATVVHSTATTWTVDHSTALVVAGIRRELIDAPPQFPIVLTPRQRAIVTAKALGNTVEQIAEDVDLGTTQIRNILAQLRETTHSATTTQLVAKTIHQLDTTTTDSDEQQHAELMRIVAMIARGYDRSEIASAFDRPRSWVDVRLSALAEILQVPNHLAALAAATVRAGVIAPLPTSVEPALDDPRARRIIQLKAAGRSDRAIAKELRVSTWTVHTTIARLRALTGSGTTAELIAMTIRQVDAGAAEHPGPEATSGGTTLAILRDLAQAVRLHTATDRERTFIRQAAAGRSFKQIADEWGVSDSTVRSDLMALASKLGTDQDTLLQTARDIRSPDIGTEPTGGFDLLSPREKEILRLLPRRLSDAAMAEELGMSTNAVGMAKFKMRNKLGVRDIDTIIKWAVRGGFAEAPGGGGQPATTTTANAAELRARVAPLLATASPDMATSGEAPADNPAGAPAPGTDSPVPTTPASPAHARSTSAPAAPTPSDEAPGPPRRTPAGTPDPAADPLDNPPGRDSTRDAPAATPGAGRRAAAQTPWGRRPGTESAAAPKPASRATPWSGVPQPTTGGRGDNAVQAASNPPSNSGHAAPHMSAPSEPSTDAPPKANSGRRFAIPPEEARQLLEQIRNRKPDFDGTGSDVYRVDTSAGPAVIRAKKGERPASFMRNWMHENAAIEYARAGNVRTPEILHAGVDPNTSREFTIMRFVPGKTPASDDPQLIDWLPDLLDQVQLTSAQPLPEEMAIDIPTWQRLVIQHADNEYYKLPRDQLSKLRELGIGPLSDYIQADDSRAGEPVIFVHNDLWPPNIRLDDEGKVWILDWERAGAGDPFYDASFFLERLWGTEEATRARATEMWIDRIPSANPAVDPGAVLAMYRTISDWRGTVHSAEDLVPKVREKNNLDTWVDLLHARFSRQSGFPDFSRDELHTRLSGWLNEPE
ncbi:LuxR C-terminal-related transcriptional regulator [Nocardia sp. NPDC052254]|uniref:LuxR C-terminal-related transcriptional regulator n=1 Tax=Nocardia sp. NPDC052254 TaxID=3155681 RepID=UPI00341CB7E4